MYVSKECIYIYRSHANMDIRLFCKVPEWHVQWHVLWQLEPHQLHTRQHLRTTQQLPNRVINTRGRGSEQWAHTSIMWHLVPLGTTPIQYIYVPRVYSVTTLCVQGRKGLCVSISRSPLLFQCHHVFNNEICWCVLTLRWVVWRGLGLAWP
jgi:hypothetical protein